MTNSKAKGKRGELLFCWEAKKYGFECRRGQQYSGIGGEDVVGLDGVHVEVKFGEKIDLKKAMGQAVRDSNAGVLSCVKIPIVAWKKNRRPWKIFMRYKDLAKIACGMTSCGDAGEALVEFSIEDWFKIYKSLRENVST